MKAVDVSPLDANMLDATVRLYAHAGLFDLTAAVNAMSSLTGGGPHREVLAAPGLRHCVSRDDAANRVPGQARRAADH